MLQITSPEFNPKTLVDLSNTQSFVPGHLNVRNTAKVAKKIYIHALLLNLLGLEVLPTISELPFSGLANSDKIVTVLACGVISDMIAFQDYCYKIQDTSPICLYHCLEQ